MDYFFFHIFGFWKEKKTTKQNLLNKMKRLLSRHLGEKKENRDL